MRTHKTPLLRYPSRVAREWDYLSKNVGDALRDRIHKLSDEELG